MLEFVLKEPGLSQYGLNRLYSGMHWAKRKQQADHWHLLVSWELRRIKAEMFEKPVYIEFFFNTKMDIDNHGYIVKLIIDGLKGIVIHDDSRKYLAGYSVGFWKGDGILVRIMEDKQHE